MITRLNIKDFKSHHQTDLPFGHLTLLSGVNSSGKSSVLQSLLLLRQSYKKGRLRKGLDLNSPLCDIGKGYDALCRASQQEIIGFTLDTDEGASYDLQFNAKGRYDDTFIPIVEELQDERLFSMPLFTNDFQYLSSSRWANLNQYPIDTYAVEEERQLSLAYGQGELVAHFLEHYGAHRNFVIESSSLLHPFAESRKLLDQTVAWEREISPRVTLSTVRKDDTVSVIYGYKNGHDGLPLEGLQSKNVGYGLSYSLSIVVALLSARPGALLLIENPEAHLHPHGQSKLSELIARTVESGVQVIVETHSDHLFNGVLKAVASKILSKEDAKVHYMYLDDNNISQHTEIEFDEHGRILNPQQGFFDQFDEDMDELMGL